MDIITILRNNRIPLFPSSKRARNFFVHCPWCLKETGTAYPKLLIRPNGRYTCLKNSSHSGSSASKLLSALNIRSLSNIEPVVTPVTQEPVEEKLLELPPVVPISKVVDQAAFSFLLDKKGIDGNWLPLATTELLVCPANIGHINRGRFVFPVYVDKKLVFIYTRSFIDSKYPHITSGYPIGFYNNDNLSNYQKIAFFESIFDAFKFELVCRILGYQDIMATAFGTNIPNEQQLKILLQVASGRKLCYFLDNDILIGKPEITTATVKYFLVNELYSNTIKLLRNTQPYGKDIGDLSPSDTLEYVKTMYLEHF